MPASAARGAVAAAEEPKLRVLSMDAPVSALRGNTAGGGQGVTLAGSAGNRSGGTAISANAIDVLLAGTGASAVQPAAPAQGGAVELNGPRPAGAPGQTQAFQKNAVQPLGRLSLAVDFPTEGHVHHFQKAKANAVLEISVADPELARRWTRIAIFAGLAVLLALGGRLVVSRRTRSPA